MANKDELTAIIKSVEQEDPRKLLEAFFEDEDFATKFFDAPASTRYHGDYAGGLADHTIGVANLCDAVVSHHGGNLNRDLLITGALLHDIGKIDCYMFSLAGVEVTKVYRTTDVGRMLGHTIIGVNEIYRKMDKLSETWSMMMKDRLIHMILSHHGPVKNGWGSAVDPQTPEAITLHYADMLESRVAGAVQHG